jgi:hypothetical protein
VSTAIDEPNASAHNNAPAADQRMERSGGTQRQPQPVPSPIDKFAQRHEHEPVGEAFGLDAADDPLTGQVSQRISRDKQRR